MRLESPHATFEMAIALEDSSATPGHGDALITIHAQSHGFSGQDEVWVSAAALTHFRDSLRQLDNTLRGEATLESLSPGELKVRLYAVNPRGLLAIEFALGRWVREPEASHWHALSGGFTFEPQQLARAIATPWTAP